MRTPIHLGFDTEDRSQDITLEEADLRQGTLIVGVNGTGKSTLLHSMVMQHISNGDGLALLDPHGDLTHDVMLSMSPELRENVILFDPADVDFPFGLNLLECDDRSNPLLVNRIESEVVSTFKKLFEDSWGPRMEHILRHAILTLILGTPGSTILDIVLLLTDLQQRERYVSRVTEEEIRHYWAYEFPTNRKTQDEWVAPILNKLGRFLVNPVIRNIVAQPKSSFDFRTIMDEGKVLLVNLSKGRLGEDNAALLGSTIVGKILIAALSRAEVRREERRQFHLIVDEFQSFATESFPTLQSEARKYAIDTTVAHQTRSQLDDGDPKGLNHGSTLNVGNYICFRLSGPDARELALQFDSTPPEPEPVLDSPSYKTGRPGLLRTDPDRILVPGRPRSYSDVEGETANRLANAANFHAHCRLIQSDGLIQRYVRIHSWLPTQYPDAYEEIRNQSRQLATPRNELEASINRVWRGDSPESRYDLPGEDGEPR